MGKRDGGKDIKQLFRMGSVLVMTVDGWKLSTEWGAAEVSVREEMVVYNR